VKYVKQEVITGSKLTRYRQPQHAEIKCSEKNDSTTCKNDCSFRETVFALCIRQLRVQMIVQVLYT